MDRQTVLKAAEAVGGVALLLPEQYDSALTGYTSQFKCNNKSTPLMVGVYDMDAIVYGPGGPVEGDDSWQDREDELLTCINRMPAPPILQHTVRAKTQKSIKVLDKDVEYNY